MKHVYRVLLLVICSLAWSYSKADHMAGMDLSFACVGQDSFKITATVYRDCTGITRSSAISISATSISCSPSESKSVSLSIVSIADITPLCRKAQSACPNPPNAYSYANPAATVPYGTEEHVYEGLLVLKGLNCCKFALSFTECCRSQGITTGAQWQNFTNSGIIDRCATPCNNSPQFRNKPILVLCVGTEYCLNQGLYEPDGDSIVYSLGQPMQSDGTPTTWNGGFSRDRPLTLRSGLKLDLDSATGDMCFTPLAQEMSILRIKVEEYRQTNGTWAKISEVNRDVQIIVVNCPTNRNPTITGKLSYNVCAGDQICLTLGTNDNNTKDTTRIYWNRGIPKGQWTDDNGDVRRAKGEFCWATEEDDASDMPYSFVVTATDDACPVNGFTSRAVRIKVDPIPKATYTIEKQKCGFVKFKAEPDGNYLNPTFEWQVQGVTYPYKEVTHQFTKSGKQMVRLKMTAAGCSKIYIDSIELDSFVVVETLPDTFVCAGQSMKLTSITRNGLAPFRYKWSTGVAADTLTSLDITPTVSGFYKITVSDAEGCTNRDSVWVSVMPLPKVDLGPDVRICKGDSATFNAYDSTSTAVTYLWSTGHTSRTITVGDSDVYWVRAIDSVGCYNTDTVKLFTNPKIVVNPGLTIVICDRDTAKLAAPLADAYLWQEVGGTFTATTRSIAVTPSVDTRYAYQVSRTYGGVQCINYDTVNVTVNPLPVLKVNGITVEACITEDYAYMPSTGQFLSFDPKTVSYGMDWICKSNPALVTNGVLDIALLRPSTTLKSIYVTCRITNANGCVKEDSLQVKIYPLPVVNAGADDSLCSNEAKITLRGTPSFGTSKKWTGDGVSSDPLGNFFFDPGAVSAGNHSLIYEFEDVNSCKNWDTVNMFVTIVPTVDAGYMNQMCIYDADFDLSAKGDFSPTGPGTGVWTGPGVYFDAASQHYKFSPYQAGVNTTPGWVLKYTYTDNGCPATDSLEIRVNPAPKIEIQAAGDTVVCSTGSPLRLDLVTTVFGTATWSGQGLTSTTGMSTNFDPNGMAAGIYKVGVIFDATSSSCKSIDTITIIVQEPPSIKIDSSAAMCKGRPFNLKASFTNAPGLEWSTRTGGGSFSNTAGVQTIYIPSDLDKNEGRIEVYARTTDPTNILVCDDAWDTLTAVIHPTPGADYTVDDADGCMPHRAQITATTDIQGSSFSWDFGDPASGSDNTATGSDVEHVYTQAGSYSITLTVTSPQGCDSVIRYNNIIKVYQVPTAIFTPKPAYTTIVLPKISFLNRSVETGNAPRYEWDFGDVSTSDEANPVHTYKGDTATYEVKLKVTTADGCEDDTVGYVQIGPDITVFIPNAFTPDNYGEGKLARNNKFYITVDGITEFHMTIYNRWGEELYTANDPNIGWDGTFRGEPVQEDVYVYQVSVRSFEGKEYKYHGTVTLLR